MKVLFTALTFANYRNFESVIRELAVRGHRVHLVAEEQQSLGGDELVERLAADYPGVTWEYVARPEDEPLLGVAQKLRLALDYVRYLHPRYVVAEKLRLRNITRTPRIVRWMTSGVGGALVGHRFVSAMLRAADRHLPNSPGITRSLEEQRPDVVLLTSLTVSRTLAMEQLKAARALDIPAAACIMSWDHLSSKALMHIQPDATMVWNEVQKHEAVDMHRIDPGTVVVTGAQCYDQWFEKRPERTRENFCRAVGLDPAKPFVLYVCSAMSPVPNPVEPVFVKEWIEALRASGDPVLRTAGILVRPHPERIREWESVTLDGLDNVVVHGRTPIDEDAKNDYFESLYYSGAVVGLCTSVFLEAAIVGRPVLTLLLPAYRMHQDGMEHFRYLLNVEGGLLQTAPDVTTHLAQLAGAMKGGGARDERNRRFVTAFVRPGGLDVPATPRFVEAVEQLAAVRRSTRITPAPSPVLGPLVTRLARAGTGGVGAWLLMDSLDDQRAVSERGREESKRAVLSERAARWDAERRERDNKLRLTAREREEKALKVRRRESKRAREAFVRQLKLRIRQLPGHTARRLRKWRYAMGTSKPVDRIKAGIKVLIGARH